MKDDKIIDGEFVVISEPPKRKFKLGDVPVWVWATILGGLMALARAINAG